MILVSFPLISSMSTKSTIKNIDETAIKPVVKDNAYQIKQYAEEDQYGR